MQTQESANHGKNPEKIKSMFAKVANNYDRANQILSLGIHHIWRNKLVQLSGAKEGHSILDCATGTGDLAIAFKKAVGSTGSVTGTDFCLEMLAPAPEKAKKQNLEIKFEQADVMSLQYPDNSFDVVSISFGIRNVANAELALKEMARVTKPGGKVMVLEFGQATMPLFSHAYNFYSEKILPVVGGWVTGQKDAYKYLQTSSAQFPSGKEFVTMMNKTECFTKSGYIPLTGGVAYIYIGIKT